MDRKVRFKMVNFLNGFLMTLLSLTFDASSDPRNEISREFPWLRFMARLFVMLSMTFSVSFLQKLT